jgi:hypothetical protein
LQTQLNIVPKVITRMWIKDFMFYMLRDCFGNLMAKTHNGILCYQWQYTSRWQSTSKWCITCYVTKSRSLLLHYYKMYFNSLWVSLDFEWIWTFLSNKIV